MWPFKKKPKTLSFTQLYEMTVPGILKMSEDPDNMLNLIAQTEGQLDEWKVYMQDKLNNVVNLESLESQAIALREIVLDALDTRSNMHPYVDTKLSEKEKMVISNKLLAHESELETEDRIARAVIQFAFSEAVVIGTFEACKYLEGDNATHWFKTYLDASQGLVNNLVANLLEEDNSGEASQVSIELLNVAQLFKEETRKNILSH